MTITIGTYDVEYAFLPHSDDEDTAVYLHLVSGVSIGISEGHEFWDEYQNAEIETRPARPSKFHTEWDGSEWVVDNESLTQEITEALKNHRDLTFANATVTLSNGAELRVDERTRRDTNDVFMGMNNANISEYAGWNAVNGSYTMGVADFQEYSVLALQEVSKAFTAYNDTIDHHGNEPFANAQEAIVYFDNEYGGE